MERKKEGKISTRNPNPKSKKNNKLIEIPKNERTKNVGWDLELKKKLFTYHFEDFDHRSSTRPQ